MKKFYALIISFLLCNTFYSQCMLYPVSTAQKVNNSNLIILGKVVSKKSFWNARHDYLYTSNLVQVIQTIKGSSASLIEIITDGGETAEFKQVVEPALNLNSGQEGVFMLNPVIQISQSGYVTYAVYSDEQGFYEFDKYDGTVHLPFKKYHSVNELETELESLLGNNIPSFSNNNNTAKIIAQAQAAPITNISPLTITAGTSSTISITGSGFGATQGSSFVQFRNADDGGATNITPHATQYLSWSNTLIVVQVPSRTTASAVTQSGQAGTGAVTVNVSGTPMVSAQTLTVSYGHINVFFTNTVTAAQIFNTRHHATNGSGGMTWRMYTGFNANTAAKNAFQNAFSTWRCATYINWQIGTTTTVNTIASDNINVIRFDIGSELPVGVLGRCTSYFQGCTFGANAFWFVPELDIVFDDATNWQLGPALATGSQYDFESVALHELGHGHQLTHVINTNDVMHYAISNAQNKRNLVADDIAGGQAVMTRNLSGAVCGQTIMSALTASTCALAAPIASFSIPSSVCVGQSITLTDISTNAPNTWTWTMTGGTPASANTQNTLTSYASAGTKTITLIAANGTGSSTVTKTVSVIANPTVAVTSGSTCSGNPLTLTANGSGTSYVWNPGAATGTSQALNPASTTVYTVVASVGSCTGSSTGTLTVVATPTINVGTATICAGSSTIMTASGAANYTWNPGNLSGATQTLNPGSTTVYNINGSNGNCMSSKITTITVSTTLAVSVTGASSVCAGDNATLTASGASNYTFNPGNITSNPAVVAPAASTNYTINGQTGGCSGSTVVAVTVATCTGMEEQNIYSAMIYPNPVSEALTVSWQHPFSGTLVIYNTIGEILLKEKISNTSASHINFSNFAKGVYIFKMTSEGAEKYYKVVKE